ncbi:uncharacterized protein LOC132603705 [Lycium barbarum]|uniref:uncharacterized protein LOC132603705 n=1 Tax=Lycium barbarum TaxID=112863 RepID=UPI00293E5DDA|nr:uncharacterized protein LOC132603705 [Lycium barbarum]
MISPFFFFLSCFSVYLFVFFRLEVIILDYLSKRGFNQIGETFSSEIHANQNHVAVNSPHEDILQVWWGKFYETFSTRFPGVPLFAAKSFDKVAQIVEDVVSNALPASPELSDADNHWSLSKMELMHWIGGGTIEDNFPFFQQWLEMC